MQAEGEREKLDEQNRIAIWHREQQRAFWALQDAMCKAEPSIMDPHVVDAKAMKTYRGALKRALRSLE